MQLCLDIGNSHLCGGVFAEDNNLLLQFRYDSKHIGSSDEIGVFMRSLLRENNIDYKEISKIGIASVVPSINYTVRAACRKYLHNLDPLFLCPGIKTGIQVKIYNPNEAGADLIAGAIAARTLQPNNDLLIFDFGTATTACFITKNGEFMGASIAPGMRLMMESLHNNTSQLYGADIVKATMAMGKNNKTAMQSGIYYSQLGFIENMIKETIAEYKLTDKLITFATGGFSHLFANDKVFDHLVPELVLLGIKQTLNMN